MKKLTLIVAIVAALFLVVGCASSPKGVSRVTKDTIIDLSGYWNDTDVRMVCEDLITKALISPNVSRFVQEFTRANNGNLPAVLVGNFKNDSSEHIDTSIITVQMRSAIINSGQLDFVAGGDVRNEIREERRDQVSGYASDQTAAALGNETGARLMLTGSVKSMVERLGNQSVRSYFVTAEMTNIETNRIIWSETNSEIKKHITQANYRP